MTVRKTPTSTFPENAKTSRRRQEIVQRRLRVLEMRKAGLTYGQIAKTLEISERTVFNDVRQSVKAVIEGDIGMERAVDLLRIEMALLPLAQGVREGDFKAIDRWKQLIDMKQKLLGKDPAAESPETSQDLSVKVIADVDMEKI